MSDIVLETSIDGLPAPRRGKVRDIYETDDVSADCGHRPGVCL